MKMVGFTNVVSNAIDIEARENRSLTLDDRDANPNETRSYRVGGNNRVDRSAHRSETVSTMSAADPSAESLASKTAEDRRMCCQPAGKNRLLAHWPMPPALLSGRISDAERHRAVTSYYTSTDRRSSAPRQSTTNHSRHCVSRSNPSEGRLRLPRGNG